MSSTTIIDPLYVADTHALLWYLKEDKRLSNAALALFEAAERGETRIVLSAITIAELYWLNKKRIVFEDFTKTYNDLKAKAYFQIISFDSDDVLDFDLHSSVPEMHDRIIVGVARRLGVSIITRDSAITESGIVRIVW